MINNNKFAVHLINYIWQKCQKHTKFHDVLLYLEKTENYKKKNANEKQAQINC
jgi:hypothetical protein